MPYGYDEIVESFKKLADSRLLFNAYLFFGEPQVGKFLFAKSLANYVENKKFEEPSNPLLETLIIDFRDLKYGKEESKESIGIDEIRELERFLYQTPINSYYRIAIIRDAEWLTDIAQNALLKILEEPPQNGVIIATACDFSVFLPTVASRMQKVYFKTLSYDKIVDFLEKYGKIKKLEAEKIAKKSFGRIGRALEILKTKEDIDKFSKIIKALSNPKIRGQEIDRLADDLLKILEKSPLFLESFFEEIISNLRPKILKNPRKSREIMQEIVWIESLSVNKRIHLKNILWKTHFILSDSS